jgi:hypothetical protein
MMVIINIFIIPEGVVKRYPKVVLLMIALEGELLANRHGGFKRAFRGSALAHWPCTPANKCRRENRERVRPCEGFLH